jgi:hypothetical protein
MRMAGQARVCLAICNRKVRNSFKVGRQLSSPGRGLTPGLSEGTVEARNQMAHVFRVFLQSFRVDAVRNQKCSECEGIFDFRRSVFVRSSGRFGSELKRLGANSALV